MTTQLTKWFFFYHLLAASFHEPNSASADALFGSTQTVADNEHRGINHACKIL